MISVIPRVVSIYKKEGIIALCQRVLLEIYHEIYSKLMYMRGHYTLSLTNFSVTFTASSSAAVKRNRIRFRSEKQELVDFIHEIEDDDIVYDIGANTGLYTFFAAMACPNGAVIGFEPYPPNLELLQQDMARNELKNVDIVEVALSDSVGEIEFKQPKEDDVGFGSSSIVADQSEATITVPTTTGDQLIADGHIPSPNVVKIDVEGAESLVIEGLTRALSDPSCRIVYCEVHLPKEDYRPSVEDFGSSPESIRKQFEDSGFTVEQLSSRQNEVFYKAKK